MTKHTATNANDNKGRKGSMDGLTDWQRDEIKRRAHALWYEAGRPQGRDREFWEQAELQVLKGHPAGQAGAPH